MNTRNNNRLNMLLTAIAVAESPAHRPVWEGKPPLAFGEDLETLKTDVGITQGIAAQLASTIDGAAEAKDEAETALEEAAFLLAAALRSYFKKTSDLEAYRKVNYAKSHLQGLRDAQLVADAKSVLAMAEAAAGQPAAAARGVTPDRLAALKTAIDTYESLLVKPRGNQVSRNTLIREMTTRIGTHIEAIADLDDLVLQFEATDAGRRFSEAWSRARTIIDAGASPAPDQPAVPETPANPAPATPAT